MGRRKGERPVIRQMQVWSENHPVAHAIRTGSHWFYAWMAQNATPLSKLSGTTGIPVGRLMAMERGDFLSRAEVDALARAWCISSEGLIASMPDPSLVIG